MRRPEFIETEINALKEVTAQKPWKKRGPKYLQKPMPHGHKVECPNVFSADNSVLSHEEEDVLAVLRADLPPDGFLPVTAFSPSALANACGQRHTGNIGSIFESLCRKGFVTYVPQKQVFHVKRGALRRAA